MPSSGPVATSSRKVLPWPGVLLTVMSPPSSGSQAFADGQSEAGAAESPAGRRIGLHEGAEDRSDLVGRHADAGIDHVDLQDGFPVFLLAEAGHDAHLAAGGELQRVAHQVDENLASAGIVCTVSGSGPRHWIDSVSPLASARTCISAATSREFAGGSR